MKNKTKETALIFKSANYYWCKCEHCGWEDSSEYVAGGGQIADTGDYDDVYCPVCGSKDIEGESKYVAEESYKDEVIEIPLRELLDPYLKTIQKLQEHIDKLYCDLIEAKNNFGETK